MQGLVLKFDNTKYSVPSSFKNGNYIHVFKFLKSGNVSKHKMLATLAIQYKMLIFTMLNTQLH